MKWFRLVAIALVVVVVVLIRNSLRRQPAGLSPPLKSYFDEGEKPTAADALAVYRELGYGSVADAFEARARPAIRLIADPSADKPLGSRIGGRPDLPDSGLWPKYKGKSQAFLAQVNLDDIAGPSPSDLLPGTGMLYFFYDAEQSTWGFDPKDRGSWVILHRENVPAGTSPAEFPDDLPEEARYQSVPVRLQADRSIPDPMGILSDLSLSEEQEDEVFEVHGQYMERNLPLHQLLGCPAPIQSDEMDIECQLASHGLYLGDATGYNDPRAKRLRAGARNWRLLMQIDSDDEAGMMWGDAGRLYFWMTEDDLRNKRFENAWMILQCY